MCFWAMVFRIQNQCAADYLIHLKFPHDLISNLNLFKNRPFRIHWHKEYLSITNHCKFARKTATQTKNNTIKPKQNQNIKLQRLSWPIPNIPERAGWSPVASLGKRLNVAARWQHARQQQQHWKTKQLETNRLEIGGSSGSVGLLQRGRSNY